MYIIDISIFISDIAFGNITYKKTGLEDRESTILYPQSHNFYKLLIN